MTAASNIEYLHQPVHIASFLMTWLEKSKRGEPVTCVLLLQLWESVLSFNYVGPGDNFHCWPEN